MKYSFCLVKSSSSIFFSDETGIVFANYAADFLHIVSYDALQTFKGFFTSRDSVIQQLSFLFKKVIGSYCALHVKGIGFRVFRSLKRTQSLYFSLGYNHYTRYTVPLNVSFSIRKGILFFFSYSSSALGRLRYQVQHLRFPDPYRGKGIRYRYQIMKFKVGKQR